MKSNLRNCRLNSGVGLVLFLYLRFDLGLTITQHLVQFSITAQSIESSIAIREGRKVFFFTFLLYTQSTYIIMAAKSQTFLIILHVILFITKLSKGDQEWAKGIARSKLLINFLVFFTLLSQRVG